MSTNKYTIKSSCKHTFFFKHEDDAPELMHIYVRLYQDHNEVDKKLKAIQSDTTNINH